MIKTDQIHFVHANGFPSSVYRKLFSELDRYGYATDYLDCHGHDPEYPYTDNWQHLTLELIHYIEARYSKPVIGLGHSMGGYLCMMAARRRPELFSSVVALDTPALTIIDRSMIRLAKQFGLVDKITPAGRTEGRRSHWPDRREALEYFQSKKLFSAFDPECLEDYISFGLTHNPEGLTLKYDPAVEVGIFRNVPDSQPKRGAGDEVPCGLIYGLQSNVITPLRVKLLRLNTSLNLESTEGGHMFPFEDPANTAHRIHKMIDGLTV